MFVCILHGSGSMLRTEEGESNSQPVATQLAQAGGRLLGLRVEATLGF